jgi:hypothetical protein
VPSDVDASAASVTGGLLGRFGARLASDSRAVANAAERLRDSWSGPASVAARRRIDTVVDGGHALSAEVGRASTAFQALATEVAELDAALARLSARATVAGLVVDDLGVHHRPGLRSVSDPATEARLVSTRESLDAELSALRARQDAAVGTLLATLDPAVAARVAAACRG